MSNMKKEILSTVSTRSELLSAYAAGQTTPGLSLLCASHLSVRPEAQAFVAAAEEFAGAGLRDLDTTDARMGMDRSALLARLDAEDDGAASSDAPTFSRTDKADAHRDGPTPCLMPDVLRRAVGASLDEVPWRFRLPGISHHVLADFDDEKVSLLKARPGSGVPTHTHRGLEATLVLSGAMRDGDAVLTRGDIALCDASHDHHPEIIGDETCYCLIVVDGALRFTGAFGRALNLFSK